MSLVNMFGNKIPAAGGGGDGLTDVKSVVFDFADNYGHATLMGVRSAEFLLSSVLIALGDSDITATSTSNLSASFLTSFMFITTKLKTGASSDRSWVSNNQTTNQRVIVTFDTVRTFDEIIINNFHESGSTTDLGVQNVKIQTTTDTGVVSTVYNSAVTDGITIFDSVFSEHIAANQADDETLALI